MPAQQFDPALQAGLASLNDRAQAEMYLREKRLQIASSCLAQNLSVMFVNALHAAIKKVVEDPDNGYNPDPADPEIAQKIQAAFNINLGLPVEISVQAADLLMHRLGLAKVGP